MRVLVTGAAGQVGAELLRAAWPADTVVAGFDRHALDITDRLAVERAVADLSPDVVVNAAAYTAVDRAEDEPEAAEAVNATAVGHLADAAAQAGARFVHLSTDYVFDGTKTGWYVEGDPIAPLGVYGATKAAGEEAARRADRHVILRTSWVYGALGSNFVTTMRRIAAGGHIRVVADQTGCPSSAADIAAAIVALCAPNLADLRGTFHLASPTATTWHEFASTILADDIAAGRLIVEPITTDEYPTPAARPQNSRLDSAALRAHGIGLRPWTEALPDVLAELDAAALAPTEGRR